MNASSRSHLPRELVFAFCLASLIPTSADSANFTWDASGGGSLDDGGGAWNPTGGSNWFNGSTYGSWGNTTADTATFGSANGAAGTVNVGSVNTNAITFAAPGSGNYTLDGGTITFGGSSPKITVNSGVTATISSTIAGAGGIRKIGTGTLYLSGNNTYSGVTALTDPAGVGETVITTDTALGSSTLQLGGGGGNGVFSSIGALGGTRIITNPLTFNGGNNFKIRSTTNDDRFVFTSNLTSLPTADFGGGISTFSGTLSATTQFRVGTGIVTLTGNNSGFTGGIRLGNAGGSFNGTIIVGHPNAIGNSGPITFIGGMLQYGAGVTTDYSSRFDLTTAGANTFHIHTGGNDVTFSTALTHVTAGGDFTKMGKGTLTLNSSTASTFGNSSNNPAVYDGTLLLDFSNMTTPTNMLNPGQGLNLFGGTLAIKGKPGAVATSQTLNGANFNVSNTNGSSNGLILDSNGGPGVSITFNGSDWNRGAGNLLHIDMSNAGAGTINPAFMTAGTKSWVTIRDSTGIGFARNTGTGTFGRAPVTTLAAGSSSSSTDYSTSGSLPMTNATHQARTLVLDATAGSGSLNMNGGTLQTHGLLVTGNNDYLISNGTTNSLGTEICFITMGSGTLTVSTPFSSGVQVTKGGPGTLFLSGAKTNTGGTRIVQGTIAVDNSASFGTGAIIVGGDSTIRSDASISLSNSITLDGRTLDQSRAPNARYLTFNTNGNSLTASGVISGGGGLIKTGAGILTLSGANTYLGGTTISEGTLSISSNSNLGDSKFTPMSISGGTLQVTGTALSNLNTRAVNWDSFNGGLDIADSNHTFTIPNSISGPGSLTKSGAGTLALTGTNTFTGPTSVSAGTLLISSGSINSTSQINVNGGVFHYGSATGLVRNVTVNGGSFKYNSSAAYTGTLTLNSGTISGSGNLGSIALHIDSGVTLAPGNSPGTMNSGTQTWDSLGTYQWEINETASSGGTQGSHPGWDWANITGNLNITATSGSKFTIDIVGLDLSNSPGIVTGFNNTQSYIWTIATFSGSSSGFDPSVFQLMTNHFTDNNSIGTGSFSIEQQGNSINLKFNPIPEPAVGSLLFLGVVAMLRRARHGVR